MALIKLADTTIESAASYQVELAERADCASIEVVATITSTAKTFVDQTLATLAQGSVTYTATADYGGTAGNAITIAYTGGGTAGAEVVTVVGTAISVQIQSGVSTKTQIKTAINAAPAAAALVTGSGTDAGTQTTAAATPLTGGVDAKFSIANNTITIATHGFATGTKARLTTTGTLPTGISLATDYYIFVNDANTITLFDTLAHCLAAANTGSSLSASTGVIDITALGSNGATHTITPVAVSGCSYKLQKSNSYGYNSSATWVDLVSGETDSVVTNNITVSATSAAQYKNCAAQWLRITFAISAGSVGIKVYAHIKKK